MSGTTIKLNSARVLLLRAAMKKEEQRLQSAASQVARIASALEMEVAAKENIDASLTKLRKLLKQGAENMSTMQSMADLAMSELTKKDEELAEKAQNLEGIMQRIQSLAGAAAGESEFGGAFILTVPESPLDLASQLAADAAQKLGDLFGLADDKLTDSLQGYDLKELLSDKVKTTAGMAGLGMAVAGGTAITLTNALDSFWGGSFGKKSSGSSSSSKKSEKKEGWLSKAGSALGDMGKSTVNWFGEKASDVKDWFEDKVEDTVDAVAAGGKWVADVGSTVWNGVQTVVASKPAQYVKETFIDVLNGAGDALSFVKNVGTGNFVEAGVDGYNFINDFFDGAQDLSAVVISGIGAGVELFGGNDEAVQFFYHYADDYANRDGLAGELHANGADGLGSFVDGLDTAAGAYKTISLGDKLFSGEIFKEGNTIKENLLTGFGWKSVDELSDSAEYIDQISHYSDLISNVKTGTKYAEGFLTDPGAGFKTVWDSSVPGKLGNGGIDMIETFDGVMHWAADQN